ncbi:MAG: endonuclease/exonuclease/phosphatase family protein [Micrococcales bacterium]|nr:endonuclease/exonuclease/phosphatase family protein [Micrococcales bacterium]MCL2667314.1 endonuclease/exonuclease/phosphatase family protein [Micrococcales bacterium]
MLLVCYNVEGLEEGAKVAEVITALGADVYALQEPGRGPWGRWRMALLIRRTGLRRVAQCGSTALLVAEHVQVGPTAAPSRVALGNAMNRVARTARFTAAAPTRAKRLPRVRPTRQRRRPMARGASMGTVDQIDILVVHLPPGVQDLRLRHLDLVADRWENRDPQLVVGDLNERPGQLSWKRLAEGGLHDMAPDTGPTYPADDPRARIDVVFGSASLRTVRAWVPDDETVRVASDHRPVVVEFERVEE